MTPPGPIGDCLVLVGPMGAGKSSVARELARRGARRWVDTDRLVAARAGMPIPEIFSRQGEKGFRRLETEVLRSLEGSRRLIIATGGGIVTRSENVPLLRALGGVVFLTASEEVLFERVSRTNHRPLLHTDDPRATFAELLARRQTLYETCAHFTVDSSDLTHAEVADAILTWTARFFSA